MEDKITFNPDRTFNIIVQESDSLIADFNLVEKAAFSSLSAILFAWFNCIYFYLIEGSDMLYASLYSALEKYGIERFSPKFISDYNDFCQRFCRTIESTDAIGEKISKLCIAIYISVIFNFNTELDMWEILRCIRKFLKHFAPNKGLSFLEDTSNLDDIIPMLYVGAKNIKEELPNYAHNRKKQETPKGNADEDSPWGCLLIGIIGAALLLIIIGVVISLEY